MEDIINYEIKSHDSLSEVQNFEETLLSEEYNLVQSNQILSNLDKESSTRFSLRPINSIINYDSQEYIDTRRKHLILCNLSSYQIIKCYISQKDFRKYFLRFFQQIMHNGFQKIVISSKDHSRILNISKLISPTIRILSGISKCAYFSQIKIGPKHMKRIFFCTKNIQTVCFVGCLIYPFKLKIPPSTTFTTKKYSFIATLDSENSTLANSPKILTCIANFLSQTNPSPLCELSIGTNIPTKTRLQIKSILPNITLLFT
ncbi:unnamed protein product [Moneuplotes crassus]|uniref:Uncharacterized protein n=1 Tax=Euplotes crassus TaxID=5936 RepID=A0AAD1XQP1_EUPCR|nr:unnamed protein product [Moneuplotes crassus]